MNRESDAGSGYGWALAGAAGFVALVYLCSTLSLGSNRQAVSSVGASEDQVVNELHDLRADMHATDWALDRNSQYDEQAGALLIEAQYGDPDPLWSGYDFSWWDGGDLDCLAFMDQDEAQAFYEWQGGPARDPHLLDSDNDGQACESLP